MESVIRKLTHDNHKFDSQWEKIENGLREECDKSNISSILDALAEYVLKEPQNPYASNCKFEFLPLVIDSPDYENKKKFDHSLFDHVFQVFRQEFHDTLTISKYI